MIFLFNLIIKDILILTYMLIKIKFLLMISKNIMHILII
jgi:hypothetical protein